jgi:uncharacterized protein YrrD
MLLDLETLRGSTVIATDGEIGTVRNFLFDGLSWRIHYLVVDVGTWFKRRDVVLAISAVEQPDWTKRTILVRLSKEQVRDSPNVDTEKAGFSPARNCDGGILGEDGLLGIHPFGGRSFNSDRKEVPCPHQRGPASPQRPGLT